MSDSALTKTIHEAFEDGTLAVLRTPEELAGLLSALPGAPSGTRTFLVTADDELNELSPVEVLAGRAFESRVEFARKIASGEVAEDHPAAHLYSGPGFTDGVHTSQQRILDAPVEVRAAKVIALARDWSAEQAERAQAAGEAPEA
jgi:hypothetical protein